MIVTTGRIIKVNAAGYYFERSAESPGLVTVQSTRDGAASNGSMSLPSNAQDMEKFISAYRRICAEVIEYRESKVEG